MIDNIQEKILKDDDREIIKEEYWKRLVNPVELIYVNTRNTNCQYCSMIKQLYTELTELTDKIIFREYIFEENYEVRESYMIENAPVAILRGLNKGMIKFYGIPAGQEFPSFLEAIVMISRGEHELPKKLIDEISKIDETVIIKTFVTPSCPYCPKMVFTTYEFSLLNGNINAEAWEIIEFPEISERYDVIAVPKIVINDKISWEGLVPPEYLLRKILEALHG